MSPGGIWAKCVGVFDKFFADKGESSLELAKFVPIKARDPIRVRTKISPKLNVEGEVDCSSIIVGEEEEVVAPSKKASPQ